MFKIILKKNRCSCLREHVLVKDVQKGTTRTVKCGNVLYRARVLRHIWITSGRISRPFTIPNTYIHSTLLAHYCKSKIFPKAHLNPFYFIPASSVSYTVCPTPPLTIPSAAPTLVPGFKFKYSCLVILHLIEPSFLSHSYIPSFVICLTFMRLS